MTIKKIKTSLQKNVQVSYWAQELLDKIPKEGQESDLKTVTLSELGFPNGAYIKEFLNNEFLEKHNLMLCDPTDVYSVLKDIKKGEWCRLGMEPITDSYGYLSVFLVAHDGGKRWLYARRGDPGDFWDGYYRWVFVRRKFSTQSSDTQSSTKTLSTLTKFKKPLEKIVEGLEEIIKLIDENV